MKFPSIIAALLAASTLSSCIYLSSKDDSLYQAPIPHYQHALSRNISFSVSVRDNTGETTHEKSKKAVRERLEKSGLFDSVYYADLENASANHLHFDFELSSASAADAGLVALSLCTLTLLPGRTKSRFHSTASLYINGRELDCYHDHRLGKVYIWFPLILGAPFLNPATSGSAMLNDAIDTLLEQVKENRH